MTVDFGNILEDMSQNGLKLFLCYERSWFLEDKAGEYYQIEPYYYHSYLDKLIKNKLIVNFEPLSREQVEYVKGLEKEIWTVETMRAFMERQELL